MGVSRVAGHDLKVGSSEIYVCGTLKALRQFGH